MVEKPPTSKVSSLIIDGNRYLIDLSYGSRSMVSFLEGKDNNQKGRWSPGIETMETLQWLKSWFRARFYTKELHQVALTQEARSKNVLQIMGRGRARTWGYTDTKNECISWTTKQNRKRWAMAPIRHNWLARGVCTPCISPVSIWQLMPSCMLAWA